MAAGGARAFAEGFPPPALDPGLWVDHYLPHWTEPERSAARYRLTADGLELRIEHDQPAWRAEDGPMRVSGLQTGSWAGPLGGTRGQHRHRLDGLPVRTAVPERRLWTPSSGGVEAVISASADPRCMTAVWLVGFEAASPDEAGEICVAELFGDRIGPEGSVVRLGIKAHHDPRLRDEIHDLPLPIDATRPHSYAAEWDRDGVRLLVDGRLVARSEQRLEYPLQLMIDLFEFPDDERRDPADYPRTAVVHRVRGGEAGAGRPAEAR